MRRLLMIVTTAAACVPTDNFDFELDPETQTVVHLVVPNCLPLDEDAVEDTDGCNPAAGDPIIRVTEDGVGVPYNLGPNDRVFIGQYRPPPDQMGFARPEGAAEMACPWREFPEPLSALLFDLEGRGAPRERMPINRRLPPFAYDECYQRGGCLDFDGDVPVCSDDCTTDVDPDPPASPTVALTELEAQVPVAVCAEGMWFDFEARVCLDPPESCGAGGWPPDVTGVFIDPDAAVNGDGTSPDTPFNVMDPSIAGAPVIVVKAGTNALLASGIDWPAELHGCWDPASGARSVLYAGLAQLVIDSDVKMFGLRIDSGIRVDSGSLELTRVDIGGEGLSVRPNTSALLEQVVLRRTSTTAVRVEDASLVARNLYIFQTKSHALDCVSSDVELTNLSVYGTELGSGVLARSGCDLAVSNGAFDTLDEHGLLIDSSTASLTNVWIKSHGGQDDSSGGARAGVMIRGSRATISSLRVGEPDHRSSGRPGLVLTRAEGQRRPHLELRRAVFENVSTGMRASGGELLLEQVFAADVDQGLQLSRAAVATVSDLLVERAQIGIEVESASMIGTRVAIQGSQEIGLLLHPLADCLTSMIDCSTSAMIVDLVVESAARGVVLDTIGDLRGPEAELARVRLEIADDGGKAFEIAGGSLALEDASIEVPASTGFLLEGQAPTTITGTDVVVIGGEAGIEVPDDEADFLDEDGLDVRGFEVFFRDPTHVVKIGDCRRPEVPHLVAPRAAASGVVGAAVQWPSREQ